MTHFIVTYITTLMRLSLLEFIMMWAHSTGPIVKFNLQHEALWSEWI